MTSRPACRFAPVDACTITGGKLALFLDDIVLTHSQDALHVISPKSQESQEDEGTRAPTRDARGGPIESQCRTVTQSRKRKGEVRARSEHDLHESATHQTAKVEGGAAGHVTVAL